MKIEGLRELEQQVEMALGPIAQAAFMPLWQTPNVTAPPPLDPPKPIDMDTFDKGKKELSQLLSKDLNHEFADVDDLVHFMILQVIQGNNSYLAAKRTFFDSERNFSNAKEEERTEAIKKETEAYHTANTWGKVERSLSSVGLVATGIAGIAAGFVTMGASAVAVGSLFAVDQLLDDKLKRVVASWIARDDGESEKNWVQRIDHFCGLVSLGMSLFTASPDAIVQAAMAVTGAVAKTTKGVLDWRLEGQKALVMELDLVCKLSQKSVDTLVMEIQEICTDLYQLHDNIHHIEEQKRKVIHSLLQFAET